MINNKEEFCYGMKAFKKKNLVKKAISYRLRAITVHMY